MTQSLDEVKEKLYKAFDRAITASEYYGNNSTVQTKNALAAAELAKAIVAVETKMDERNEKANGLRLPGKL
jgi:hypothetical protein